MIVSYTHPDGTVDEVSTDDLSAKESADIEGHAELEWDDVERALKMQKPTAMRAVLWAFRKRQEPQLRFSAFDVPGWKRRLKARLEYEEILDLIESLRAENKTDAEFDEMVGYLRALSHDPADVDRALADTAPKAPEPVAKPKRATKPVEPPSEESAATS